MPTSLPKQVLAAAVVVASAAAHGQASRTPEEWLQAMDDAFRSLDYDGVFSYYAAYSSGRAERVEVPGHSGSMRFSSRVTASKQDLFRIVHKVVDGVEHERIVHLNGPSREILRTGDAVTGVMPPGDELLAVEGAIPAGPYANIFARRFREVGANYDIHIVGQDRIVGRPAVRLAVTPRDEDRFGYRLWLDADTGLLLRSELHDEQGAKLEIFQFTSLRTDAVAAADLEPAAEARHSRRLPTAAGAAPKPAGAPQWQVRWVPPGFRLTSADAHRPGHAEAVDAITYSDGLASFSVFVEAMPEAGAGSVLSRTGATVVLTHVAAGGGEDHLVTVVGEMPVATARRIAGGVMRRRQ